MYLDSAALIAILTDEAARERAAAAIAGARKRFTSPLAVVEAALALVKYGKTEEEAAAEIDEFLDANGIELRDLPPARRLVALTLAATSDGAGITQALNQACAGYYEVETFSPDAPTAEPQA